MTVIERIAAIVSLFPNWKMEPTYEDENRSSKTNKQTNKLRNPDDEKEEDEADKNKKRKFRTAISFALDFVFIV